MTPGTCRAARALLYMTRADLSRRAHVGVSTLAWFECGVRVPHDGTHARIKSVLEESGDPTTAQRAEAVIASARLAEAGGRREPPPSGGAAAILAAHRKARNEEE